VKIVVTFVTASFLGGKMTRLVDSTAVYDRCCVCKMRGELELALVVVPGATRKLQLYGVVSI
jgi:hypothetical protein